MSNGEQEIVRLIPRLRRYARALSGSADRADDLVQASLERGLSRLHLWRRGSDLRAWMFTIMHNLYVNDMRRARIKPDSRPLGETEAGASTPANQEDVVALHSVVGLLQRLPEEQRQTVLLVALEEMTYREVAKVTGVPVGTVMSRLARGRERLRRLVEERGDPLRSRSVS